MSEPIKHRDHLWLVSVFGSAEERAKAEMAERGDREGVVVCFFSPRGRQQATSTPGSQESK